MDAFTLAMFEAALWSETEDNGTPLDEHHGISDFAKPVREALELEAQKFQRDNAKDIERGLKKSRVATLRDPDPYVAAGHDFWLTRNGHGAGFWDGDWTEPAATRLTKASKRYRPVALYVHRGKIWASGYEGRR
jgi:hypothetical protein